MQVTTGI
jgi:hypothetical protein